MKKILLGLGIFLVSVLVFAVIGQLVGSYAFIRFAKAPVSPGVFTLWELYKNSQGPGGGIWVMWQFKAGVILAATLTLAPVFVGIAILFNRPGRQLHGSARFARPGEVAKAGLLKDEHEKPDIIIGQYKGKYLRWGGNQYAFVAAPPRSGKGVGIVIPNCLHYRDSLVVFDPKLENYEITAGYREAHGQEVFLLHLSTKDFRSHCWNPLSYVKRDPDFAPGGAFSIAHILYPTSGNMSGNSVFFNEMAQKLFVGLCLYLIETENETGVVPSMPALLKLATPADGQSLADWIKETVKDRPLSDACKSNLLSYVPSAGGQTGAGVISNFMAPLSVFSDPVVAGITSRDDFDLCDVRRKRMSIYVGVNPNDFSRFGRLINLFFSQLISVNTEQLPEQNPELKYQCLLMMDEAAAMGKVEIILTSAAYIAGYELRLLMIFQNRPQMNNLYGADGAQSLLGTFDCQIIFATRDNKDAQEYSEIIGYETVHSKNRSTGKSGRSISEATGEGAGQRRAVMLPQEIKAMPNTDCVINMPGMNTIYAKKVRYYDDPVFKQRLGFPQPMIPKIDRSSKANAQANTHAAAASNPEAIPAHELDSTPLETVSNKDDLMQAVISALSAEDSPPEYLDDLKQAVAKAWQGSGTRAFEKVLGTI